MKIFIVALIFLALICLAGILSVHESGSFMDDTFRWGERDSSDGSEKGEEES